MENRYLLKSKRLSKFVSKRYAAKSRSKITGKVYKIAINLSCKIGGAKKGLNRGSKKRMHSGGTKHV